MATPRRKGRDDHRYPGDGHGAINRGFITAILAEHDRLRRRGEPKLLHDARYSSTGPTTPINSVTARSSLAMVDSEYGKDAYLEAPVSARRTHNSLTGTVKEITTAVPSAGPCAM